MKKTFLVFFFLFPYLLMAQNLDNLWKEIEALPNGQEITLNKVNAALEIARKNQDFPMVAKALFFQAKNQLVLKENYDINVFLKDFKAEFSNLKSPLELAVSQIYLAKIYETYQAENYYKLRNRTDLEERQKGDLSFWTNADFNEAIHTAYSSALSHKTSLLKEPIAKWRKTLFSTPDLLTIERIESLTPTLFHYYAHLFINSKAISEEEKLGLISEIRKIDTDNQYISSLLYNKNIEIKSGDKYVDNLQKLIQEHPENWYTSELYKFLATEYYQEGGRDRDKSKFEKVIEIKNIVAKKYKDSEALKTINNLVDNINSHSFFVEMSKYVSANQNIPMLIKHKNVDRLYIKVIDYNVGDKDFGFQKVYNALNSHFSDSEERFKAFMKEQKEVVQYEISIKKFDDYLEHSSIYNFKKLPKGRYLILVSEDSSFKYYPKSAIQFFELGVSDYSISSDGKGTFFVNNNQTGKPVENAKIDIFSPERNDAYKLSKTLTTNKKGEASSTLSGNMFFKLQNENVVYNQGFYWNRGFENKTKAELSTQFFTDRAIYRPGQTVYFKAIIKKTEDRNIEVVVKESVKIFLKNNQGQIVQEATFVTNEMGSVSGEFTLPSSGLTGYFSLESSISGYKSIQVEEYKRPTFFVNVLKPEKSYQLNDSIRISGKAESFAGAFLAKSNVVYTVFREVPRWKRGGYGWPIENDEQIAFGETQTNEKGEFEFLFVASAGNQDTYSYRIEAKVTDINGETQTAKETIAVGKIPLIVRADLSPIENVDNLKEINIVLENLNEKSVSGQGKVKISKLKSPQDVIVKSTYEETYNYFSKEEFKKLFGNLSYGKEADPSTWDVEKVVFEDTFSSRKIKVSDSQKWQEAYYKVEIEATDGKYTVQNSQIIFVENQNQVSPITDVFKYSLNKENYEVGDTVKIKLRTGADLLYLSIRGEVDSKLFNDEVLELKKGEKILTFIVEQKHLGGFYIHYKYVKYNLEEKGSIAISVPYEHKKLKIETEVLRDILQPGTNEKWKLKIAGNDIKEGLAAMYDASLDKFAKHSLEYFAYNFYNSQSYSFGYQSYPFVNYGTHFFNKNQEYKPYGLEFSPYSIFTYNIHFLQSSGMGRMNNRVAYKNVASPEMSASFDAAPAPRELAEEKAIEEDLSQIQARGNLQETAFFYPEVFIEKDGSAYIEFVAPESLTQWKFMFFAHTKDMKTGYLEKLIKTQKDLMITPNLPRFLRENDELRISAKIDNLTDQKLKGTARLYFMDPITDQILDSTFANLEGNKNFEVENSAEVNWTIKVPKNLGVVKYKMVAKAGDFTDGVEGILTILTNRMLVTETLPLFVKENQTKDFTFEKLKNNNSPSLESKKLSLEFTSNPVWYAVFSLPYLKEGNTQFSEQIFGKIYASSVGNKILNDNPKIKAVFDQWNKEGLTLSPLKRNQDLKNILIEETPWLKSDENSVAALFEINQMRSEVENNLRKLSEIQRESGGFPWYADGKENEFITAQIVSGFGAMKKMGVELNNKESIKKAIDFLDKKQLEHYEEQLKLKKPNYNTSFGAFYLYARSFYLNEYPLPKNLNSLLKIYLEELKKDNKEFSDRALSALVLGRFKETKSAQKFVNLLKGSAVKSDEMGMYWKANTSGWGWNQVPVVNHTLAIEAFDENTKDTETIEALKIWLLKQRQTQSWSSSLSTVKAVYVLLNTGKNWISSNEGVNIKIGSEKVEISSSGFVKKTWESNEIKPDLANIEVQKKSAGPAWGSLYWQYFEDLDKITKSATGIAFNKKIYKKKSVEGKEILEEITEKSPIKVGDILTVRLEISSDRTIDFVHIKDMRASGLEPINVISSYKYQEGLSYYESTRDAATHFFVDKLYKGKYIFVYDLKANISGTFSNGITQIQSAFAPEFSANSKGDLILIKN